MIDKTTIEIEDLRAHLTETQGKLFEAGKLAGEQDLKIDRLTEALLRLRQWAKAYPVAVFRPLTDDQLDDAAKALADSAIDMGALHAQWARHILDDLTKIIDKALKP